MAMPPQVRAAVGGFLELFPGAMANGTNLETLLALIVKDRFYEIMCGTATVAGPRIVINRTGTKRKPELVLDVFEPMLLVTPWVSNGSNLCRSMKPATAASMLAGIVEVTATLKALARGLCETCGTREPPRKELKGPGFRVCLGCALLASFGL